MNKYISILGYNRVDLLKMVFEALLCCDGVSDFHIRVFLDGPKTQSDNDNSQIIKNYFDQSIGKKICRSFSLETHVENMGVWRNKLYGFSRAFEEGADYVLLLEDDVLLKPDALTFVDQAFHAIDSSQTLFSVSLFSSFLMNFPGVPHEASQCFLKNNFSSTFCSWGIRSWPFPWGLGLNNASFFRIKNLGWNGNDQNMSTIMVKNGGKDIFPIISRSSHIGESSQLSSTHKVYQHLPFDEENYRVKDFKIEKNIDVKAATDRADYFYLMLKNDFAVDDVRIKIITDSEDYSQQKRDILKKYKYLDIDVRFVSSHSISNDEAQKLDDVLSRISVSDIFLDFHSNELDSYARKFYQSKGVRVLSIDDLEKIFTIDLSI